MAVRTKGSFGLAGAIEPKVDAPLDARSVVNNLSDLTTSGSFPYKYVGMSVFVKSELKRYTLIGNDTTDINNWREEGSGESTGTGAGYAGNGTLLASGWNASNQQTLTFSDYDADMNGVIGMPISTTSAQKEAYANACIDVVSQNNNVFTFQCVNIPEVDLPVTLYAGGGSGSGTGTGGSGSLESAITSVVDIGGISAGDNFAAGTSYDELFDALLNPTLNPTLTAPSASLSGTGDKLLEAGATQSVTLTASFNRGSISPAYGTSGYRSGAATGYTLNGGTQQSANTWTETVSASNKTFQASVAYGAGEQPKNSKGGNYGSALAAGSVNTGSVTYDFVDAMWANTAAIGTVAKLSLVAKSTKQRDMVFPAQTTVNPEVFDIPASWTVTAVQVKNDLSGAYEDASSQFTVTDTTHNNAAGTAVNYKRYTFNMNMATGARTVRVKWS